MPTMAEPNRSPYVAKPCHGMSPWAYAHVMVGQWLARRAALRRELLWEGFGLLSPGTFAHPVVDGKTDVSLVGDHKSAVIESRFIHLSKLVR